MSDKSPYLTLAGAASLFAVLIIVNMAQAPDRDAKPSEYGGAPSSSETTEPDETEPTEPDETEPEVPDAPVFPSEAVYAGHTNKGGGPAIAIAILNGKAAAYFCDGVSIEAWLKGTADDGEFELGGSDAEVKGDLIKGRLVGEVDVGDREYQFSIRPASPPAGLYRADGDGATIGWIVLPDGSQVGIANVDGSTDPAPELDPGAPVEVGGEEFNPRPVTGDADF